MANPRTLQPFGNSFLLTMDDGVKHVALPTNGVLWVFTTGSGGGGPVDPPDPVGGFKWPFDPSVMTTYNKHSGGDFAGNSVGDDAPVKCIGPGVVQAVYRYDGNTTGMGENVGAAEPIWRGNCVVVNHGVIGGHEVWSLYAHLRYSPPVNEGDTVTGGQVIGNVGNSGYSFGAHLHLEAIYDGQRLTNSMGGGFERLVEFMNANASGVW